MIDWTKSMSQTFEYYIVDPGTWKDMKPLNNVKSSSINRDKNSQTLGSATINVTDSVGECYIRIYLIATQNGITEKIPLGTFLVQTPSSNFNGRIREVNMDAYTPLLELKENQPPIGYTILKDANIMESAYISTRNFLRAPVVKPECNEILTNDFVADLDDTWMTFLSDLIANAKYEYDIDEMGRILFAPKQDLATLQPVWEYNDDNSSILLPDIELKHDIYGIPNVVEVVCNIGTEIYHSIIENNDPNSPTSIIQRGRKIIYRDTSPSLQGIPTKEQVDEYAEKLLKTLNEVEYEISYSHGYCPVRVGDCVRLNYQRADLNGVKAKVISQKIECDLGCKVSEVARFSKNLWK